jgi:hypothetical protein
MESSFFVKDDTLVGLCDRPVTLAAPPSPCLSCWPTLDDSDREWLDTNAGKRSTADAYFWPTGGGRLSQMLALNQPVRSGLEWQQSGVDFDYLSTRQRPQAVLPGTLGILATERP